MQLRIGETSIRPFGCSASLSSQASTSMGCRISASPKDQGCRKVPLQGVYHRIRLWLAHQYSRGEEPRPTQVRLRCELELATEIGTQRALQKHRPALFQEYVLTAARARLQWLQNNRQGKQGRDWLNQTLLPRVGGDAATARSSTRTRTHRASSSASSNGRPWIA